MRFIPYDKLSKKKRRIEDSKKRNTWGQINPCSKKELSKKVYSRKKNLLTYDD